WQTRGSQRLPVTVHYSIAVNGAVGFTLGSYDATLPLIIDPSLTYSTYLGGNGNEAGCSITTDDTGAIYIAGYTSSSDFPTTNPITSTLAGYSDIFVTKLTADGSAKVYSTYLGGNGNDGNHQLLACVGVAVDAQHAAYLAGYTDSSNFPMVNAYQGTFGGASDAFVAKISAAGSSLLYSSYFGGVSDNYASGIAVDAQGIAYVVGSTCCNTSGFPIRNAYQSAYVDGYGDAFIMRIDASQSGSASLLSSTSLGGSDTDIGAAITLDRQNNIYVTGWTSPFPFGNTPFPHTASAPQLIKPGAADAFIAKLNPTATQLVYGTYLGGS